MYTSSTAAVANSTIITLQGTVENTSDYPANNTIVSVFSTYVPTMNITSKNPDNPVNIAPHTSAKFEFKFFPRTIGDMEIGVIALPENGMPAKSAPIRISVVKAEPASESISTEIIVVTSVAAAGTVAAFSIFKRRHRVI